MDDLSPRSPERNAPAVLPTRISMFVFGWLLAAVAAAVFLAAGPAQGSLGIFLAAAGAVLTFVPARVHVGWPLWVAVGGLLVCGSLSFLPARWFALPAWRATLSAEPAIHLPWTITPVPWETGFWLGVLGASCLTGLYLLAHPLRSRSVLGLAAAAVVVCGVYAGLSIYARQTGWHYPYAGGATFGFFPNRNHTATFLITGSIAALGVVTISLRENRWVLSALAVACLATCVAGLFFYSGSRAGIIFLLVGTVVWAGGLGQTHRNVPLNVSLAVLTLAAGVLFLLSGGEARSRLLGGDGPAGAPHASPAGPRPQDPVSDAPAAADRDTSFGFRALIYHDAFELIKDAPVTGTGLGAFAPAFARYRRASLSGSLALHPESDWLMLAAEAGVPAVFFALSAVGLVLARLRGAHLHPYWPLRWGCVSAALAAALHGIVDVPAHRVVLGWWIVLLVGLGTHAGRGESEKSRWPQKALFVAGGLATLTLGMLLIRAEWFGGRALPPFAAAIARNEILAMFNRQDVQGALARAQEAVETSPMAAPLYYQVGNLLLRFEGTDADADATFRAQRLLDPGAPNVPLQQGDAWLPIDPKRAVALWLEAMGRQVRIDQANTAAPLAGTFFHDLVIRAAPSPDSQRELAAAAISSPERVLEWLDGASAPVAREELPVFAAQSALLARFSEPEREKFLLRWRAKGSREELARFVEDHESWRQAAWPIELRALLDSQQYEAAVRAAAEHYHVALTLPAAGAPEDAQAQTPAADASPVAAFEAYWRAGNNVAARRVLEDAVKAEPASKRDPEIWRLQAALDAQAAAWPSAWQNLDQYLRDTRHDEAVP